MKKIPVLVWGVLLPSLVPVRAWGIQETPDPTAILERASAEFSALSGFCADFEQTLSVPLLDQVTHSSGHLCQQQPDLFSMRFSDPEGDVIVADGEWLWIYFPSTDPEQVIRSPMTADGQGRFDFHREFLSDPGSKYAPSYLGRGEVDGASVHIVGLTPRQRSAYREARVWIDDGLWLIRRAEIEEENGNLRTVELAGMDRTPAVGAEFFRFTPPPGAQIITR